MTVDFSDEAKLGWEECRSVVWRTRRSETGAGRLAISAGASCRQQARRWRGRRGLTAGNRPGRLALGSGCGRAPGGGAGPPARGCRGGSGPGGGWPRTARDGASEMARQDRSGGAHERGDGSYGRWRRLALAGLGSDAGPPDGEGADRTGGRSGAAQTRRGPGGRGHQRVQEWNLIHQRAHP